MSGAAAQELGIERRRTDVVVVGSGVAGLSVALRLAGGPGRSLGVTVLSKTGLGDGSSRMAQGGIACALGAEDSPERHAADTLAVAGGLGSDEAVRVLTHEAPEAIVRLTERGARFDRSDNGSLELGLEGGHSRSRILHAGGDATGAEVMRALLSAVRSCVDLEVAEETTALELVTRDGRIGGILAVGPNGGRVLYETSAVVLATGGFGAVYLKTTNPAEATGDGIAIAARAGAVLSDMEFVQFHPTALDVGAEPMPLLTEALRGAGAVLVDSKGERFMTSVSPMAELAPRDVVARAIWERLAAGQTVRLDARSALLRRDFPTAVEACRRHGLDLTREPVPVSPAAHYTMGGIAVDLAGRSSLQGLWVCGEAAASGLHGANRLASNSLLEGLVFGARVGDDIAARLVAGSPRTASGLEENESWCGPRLEDPGLEAATRRLLWEHAGLVRTEHGLSTVQRELSEILSCSHPGSRALNQATVALLVAKAARSRRESRGSHYRRDFQERGPAWRQHLYLACDPSGLEPRLVEAPFREPEAVAAGSQTGGLSS